MPTIRKTTRTTLDILARQVSERDLQQNVLDLLRASGFYAYHVFDSRRSEPGFPDVIAVHPLTGRMIVAELKRENGRLTAAQRTWLAAFRQVYACEVYVFRPSDWLNGSVERIILQRAAA